VVLAKPPHADLGRHWRIDETADDADATLVVAPGAALWADADDATGD
jgi:hypothetical protein